MTAHQNIESLSRSQLIGMIDNLQAELEAVKESVKPDEKVRIQNALGLTGLECDLLMLLADGRERTKDQIYAGLYKGQDDAPEPHIIAVYACKLRKKISHLGASINVIWGRGYQLVDPDGVIAAIIAGDR